MKRTQKHLLATPRLLLSQSAVAQAVKQILRAPHHPWRTIGGLATAGLLTLSTSALADFPSVIELSDLDGTNGFVLNGVNAYDFSGSSVSGAGDINGDGIADLFVGAREASPNGRYSGTSYVVFGRNTSAEADFPAAIELSSLDGSDGFVLNGVNAGDYSGISVSGAGDINGDGIVDLLIGAPYAAPNGSRSGTSYVVFGRNTSAEGDFPAAVELSSLDGSNGFVLNGVNAGDYSGISVSGAGDINGDGIVDLLIGASGADPNGSRSGTSYVVFGRNTAAEGDFPAAVELSYLNGSNGFVLNGVNTYDDAGKSVSGAGDINGDGIVDLIIGAYRADPNGSFSGASYVVFGRNTSAEGEFPAAVELSSLDGSNGFVLNGVNAGDRSGKSVSGAGDINGDGIADLIVGADNVDTSGASYVVFGRDTAAEGDFPAAVELSSLDGANGFVLNGVNTSDFAGRSVSGAADADGDGIVDLLIGAPYADPNGFVSGASYVVFGRNTAAEGDFPAAVELSSLDGSNGFVLNGAKRI